MAWPLIISMGSFTLMQFIDRMFLAWYSPVSIQAALPAGLLSFTLICTFFALSGYANTFVAQYHGAGDPIGCSRSVAQAVWLSVLSWPLLFLLVPVGIWILEFSNHAPAVLAEEKTYFTILTAGGVVVPLGAAISSFFTGRGHNRTNMLATIAGNVVNAVLDYMFIFGRWGAPEMGIKGAAIATVIAGLVTPAILFTIYFWPSTDAVYCTRSNFQIRWALLVRMVRFGLPSGLNLLSEVGSFSFFILLSGRLGEMSLAVSNMTLSINTFAFLPLIGLSIAAATLVGQYQGRGDSDSAALAAWRSVVVGLVYVSIVGATYNLFPRFYFYTFVAGAENGYSLDQLVEAGRTLLVIMAVWGIMDAVNIVLAGALKGAGDTRFVLVYSMIVSWLIWIPAVMVTVVYFGGGLVSMWLWAVMFVAALAIGYTIRFRGGKWRTIQVIETPAPPPASRVGGEALAVGE